MSTSIEPCELCLAQSGQYRINRLCCALRLVRSTPDHGARAATWAHLAATMDGEQFTRLREVATELGIIKRRPPRDMSE